MKEWARLLIGTRGDWRIYRPVLRLPTPSRSWIGSLIVVSTAGASWLAFSGAPTLQMRAGFFAGAVAIVLMAWSFVLAVRFGVLESIFGGLDSMYRVHRWAGSVAIVSMWLHTQLEPEMDDGVPGASKDVADAAQDLAETAETIFYVLVGLSVVRLVPYRVWRISHKLLGIPFALACWHFYTATKPYANGSPWGLWFVFIMLSGLVAWIVRVLVRDMVAQGTRYEVSEVQKLASATRIRLASVQRQTLRFDAGQFAFLTLKHGGLSETHPFTIASTPGDDLEFIIGDLGDWTMRLHELDPESLIGSRALVEGPYGRFRPLTTHTGGSAGGARSSLPNAQEPLRVWIAGGIGITPFLSAIGTLDARPEGESPTIHLFYGFRNAESAVALDRLRRACAENKLILHTFESSKGSRVSGDAIAAKIGLASLAGSHWAACGPASLLRDMKRASADFSAASIEIEDFDFRQGFGPDISRELAKSLASARR